MTNEEYKASIDILDDILNIYTTQYEKRSEKRLELRIKQLESIRSLLLRNYADVGLAKARVDQLTIDNIFLKEKIQKLEQLNTYKSEIIDAADKKLEQYAKEWRLD